MGRMAAVRDALDYLRTYGVGAATRKAVRVYLRDEWRAHLGRVDHVAAAREPMTGGGLTFRPARPDDVPRLVAAFDDPATPVAVLESWIRPPGLLMLALDGERPVAYQSLLSQAPPSVRPVLPPDPGRFFSGEVLAHPSVRGRGVVRHLMVASTHLLLERGVRERWFTINAPNHLSEDAFFRGAHARERVGTLTRRSHLGRVRYEFVPATAPTTPRLDRLVALLSAVRGPVARVAVLLNPASLTVDPRHAGDAIAGVAPPGVALSPVVVREPEDPAAALRRALGEIGRSGADGLVVLRDAMLARYARLIVAHAARRRLPAVYEGAPFAAAGGLVVCRAPVVPAHGWPEPLRRLGAAADHGPEVVVNARAAGALGLALPS